MRRGALEFGEPGIGYAPEAAKGDEFASIVVQNLALERTASKGELPIGRYKNVFVGKCG